MSAWSERGGAALDTEPSSPGERDPIAVFRSDGIVEGWIPKLEGRISDGLNDADRMRIRAQPASGGPADWLELNLDQVMAVAAPPRAPSEARVARRPYAVEVDAGPYRMQGIAHLPLGTDPERHLASTLRRWLPLTDCTITDGSSEWAVDVVIVNLDLATDPRTYYLPPSFL